jgi:hypothetical protein
LLCIYAIGHPTHIWSSSKLPSSLYHTYIISISQHYYTPPHPILYSTNISQFHPLYSSYPYCIHCSFPCFVASLFSHSHIPLPLSALFLHFTSTFSPLLLWAHHYIHQSVFIKHSIHGYTYITALVPFSYLVSQHFFFFSFIHMSAVGTFSAHTIH